MNEDHRRTGEGRHAELHPPAGGLGLKTTPTRMLGASRFALAADPAVISVRRLAFSLRSGGGLRHLNAFAGGAPQDRSAGGARG